MEDGRRGLYKAMNGLVIFAGPIEKSLLLKGTAGGEFRVYLASITLL